MRLRLVLGGAAFAAAGAALLSAALALVAAAQWRWWGAGADAASAAGQGILAGCCWAVYRRLQRRDADRETAAFPVPPEHVRLVWPGGTIPVECCYVGYIDGLHTWEIVTPVRLPPGRFQVAIGKLPARTTVRFTLAGTGPPGQC